MEINKKAVSFGNCKVGKITSKIYSKDAKKSFTIEFTKDSFVDFDTIFLEKTRLANWL